MNKKLIGGITATIITLGVGTGLLINNANTDPKVIEPTPQVTEQATINVTESKETVTPPQTVTTEPTHTTAATQTTKPKPTATPVKPKPTQKPSPKPTINTNKAKVEAIHYGEVSVDITYKGTRYNVRLLNVTNWNGFQVGKYITVDTFAPNEWGIVIGLDGKYYNGFFDPIE